MIGPASLMHSFPWGKSGTELYTWVKRRCYSTLAERATGKPSRCPQKLEYVYFILFLMVMHFSQGLGFGINSASQQTRLAERFQAAPRIWSMRQSLRVGQLYPLQTDLVWTVFLVFINFGTRYGSNKTNMLELTNQLGNHFISSWVINAAWAMGCSNPH